LRETRPTLIPSLPFKDDVKLFLLFFSLCDTDNGVQEMANGVQTLVDPSKKRELKKDRENVVLYFILTRGGWFL
jgi:hypothetical protein